MVVPLSLRARLPHMALYTPVGAHPGGRKMYRAFSLDYYWPSIAVDVYATVRRCPRCARERVRFRSRATNLKLFPSASSLEDVAHAILGELLTTPRGNRYLLVIPDWF